MNSTSFVNRFGWNDQYFEKIAPPPKKKKKKKKIWDALKNFNTGLENVHSSL